MRARVEGFFIPDHEQSAMAFLYRDQSPLVIAGHTGKILELYRHRVIPRPDEYLQTDTLPYLKEAMTGLTVARRRAALQPEQQLTFFSGTTRNMQDWETQAMEAFGYTLVVFAALPEFAKSPLLPQGFSRQGVLKPPTEVREFWERMHELQQQIQNVSQGRSENSTSFTRTYQFFQVARDLPMRMPENQYEREERAREEFNKLLGDTKIDLNPSE